MKDREIGLPGELATFLASSFRSKKNRRPEMQQMPYRASKTRSKKVLPVILTPSPFGLKRQAKNFLEENTLPNEVYTKL